MTNITETATWAPNVHQLDTTEQVLGGAGGPSNAPIINLACRTAYLKAQVEARALIAHSHGYSDVPGLFDALAGKAPIVHAHAPADVAGLDAAIAGKAPYSHIHSISDSTGLQAALDGKAPASHTHGIANITSLQATLDGKALLSHSHSIPDVIGLQVALDGKSGVAHSHTIAISDLVCADGSARYRLQISSGTLALVRVS